MLEAPVAIGPFLIARDGQLTLRVPEPVPGFSFNWRGVGFMVRLSAGTLALVAQVGRIPSTAEGRARRAEALEVLRALPAALPPAIRLRLLPDHRLQLESEAALAWPSSATALFAPIVAMMLRTAPVLDLLREAGF
jgi:hypothetical protein